MQLWFPFLFCFEKQYRSPHNMASLRISASNSRSCNYPPFCHCDSIAKIRIVVKNNHNKGRKFWGCRHYLRDDIPIGCNFFVWYTEPDTQFTQPQSVTTDCGECSQKDKEIRLLRRALLKMKDDEILAANKRKNICIVTLVLVAFTCLVLAYMVCISV